MKLRPLSLFWKTWLSTSVALTLVFAITGWVVQRDAVRTTSSSIEDEVKTTFRAYESIWRQRAETLASISSVLSSMPQVRAAFGTGDEATIRDTGRELWSRLSEHLKEDAIFVVTDPRGHLLAALGNAAAAPAGNWPVVSDVGKRFPSQVSGFYLHEGSLYQMVVTPVYVDSGHGSALISVLVAGYPVTAGLAQRLKESTGGSDFLFISRGRVFASTLDPRASNVLAGKISREAPAGRISDGSSEYIPLVRDLIDMQGRPIGKLCIFHSFEGVRENIAALTRNVVMIWLLSISAGLVLTYLLARRIVEPVKQLDRAAAEVARQNYDYRVPVTSSDELGRLAATFNSMGQSLQAARAELIRRERINTIGRMATSIVHDLRNPLAAIYGGAEMMVDTELSLPQLKRLASNIYRASQRIQVLLQDLLEVSRGKSDLSKPWHLRTVIASAAEAHAAAAEAQSVRIHADVPPEIAISVERVRIERVFSNLIQNALEVMPDGGEVRITASEKDGFATVLVEDTGPGISPEIRNRLFEPFASWGKKGGLGLGLALSRQAVLDHGGEMWAESGERGARFVLKLPTAPAPHPSSQDAKLTRG